MKRYLIMALSLLGLFGCKAYSDLNTDAFDAKLGGNTIQLVDVRTPEEYAEGHLRGSVNIDWQAADFEAKEFELLSKDYPVLVYCRSGRRSAEAAAKLGKDGYDVFNLTGGYVAWTEAEKPVTIYETECFRTPSGEPVVITLIKHGSLEIRYKGQSIQVDPVSGLSKPTDYAVEFPKADFILVTHEHGDHLDPKAIEALRKDGTQLITNARCAGMLGTGDVMANGEDADLAPDIRLEAVPAYNITEGREMFHPKGRDNGFILTLDGLRIYIAGDTEDIPEMANIKNIDVAFLPVNQPYTMTVEQCVHAANVIGPKVLIPYHFSQTDLSSLQSLLPKVEVRLRQMQ